MTLRRKQFCEFGVCAFLESMGKSPSLQLPRVLQQKFADCRIAGVVIAAAGYIDAKRDSARRRI